MDLVLFGIQGSGKGTQARKLAAEFGFSVFETGGQLRGIAASGTELGNLVKSSIDRGNLVSREIVMEVVCKAIAAQPKDQRILFDGIPRDTVQQRDFDAAMADAGRDFRCIHLILPKDVAIQRLLGRAALEGRTDDASEAFIRQRMSIFWEKTMSVIEQYKAQGKLVEIDGNRGVEEVYGDVRQVTKNL